MWIIGYVLSSFSFQFSVSMAVKNSNEPTLLKGTAIQEKTQSLATLFALLLNERACWLLLGFFAYLELSSSKMKMLLNILQRKVQIYNMLSHNISILECSFVSDS